MARHDEAEKIRQWASKLKAAGGDPARVAIARSEADALDPLTQIRNQIRDQTCQRDATCVAADSHNSNEGDGDSAAASFTHLSHLCARRLRCRPDCKSAPIISSTPPP